MCVCALSPQAFWSVSVSGLRYTSSSFNCGAGWHGADVLAHGCLLFRLIGCSVLLLPQPGAAVCPGFLPRNNESVVKGEEQIQHIVYKSRSSRISIHCRIQSRRWSILPPSKTPRPMPMPMSNISMQPNVSIISSSQIPGSVPSRLKQLTSASARACHTYPGSSASSYSNKSSTPPQPASQTPS